MTTTPAARSTWIALLFCAVLHAPDCAAELQPPGAIDPAFGIAGVVHTGYTPVAIMAQPDGKLVVAGNADPSDGSAVILSRYLSNGVLDGSFGQGGVATVRVAPPGFYVAATTALAQDDGRIVVGGSFDTSPGTAGFLVRLLPNGAVDSSFGEAGFVRTGAAFFYFEAKRVLALADAKLVFIGNTEAGAVMVGYHRDGTLDAGYGDHGVAGPAVEGTNPIAATAAAAQGDGSIALAADSRMVRFDATGKQDMTFGTVRLPHSATDLAATADGKLIAAGSEETSPAAGVRFDRVLMKFHASGTADTTFGDGGVKVVGFGEYRLRGSARVDPWPGDKSTTVVVLPDQRIVTVAKTVEAANGPFSLSLVGHLANGEPDPSFGRSGISVGPVADTIAGVAAIDGQGRLLVGMRNPSRVGRFVLDRAVDWPLTTTTLTSDRSEIAFGEPLTLTVAVAGKTPVGFVEIYVETNEALASICSTSIIESPWQATCMLDAVGATPEPLLMTARYLGSASDFPSVSATLTVKTRAPASGAAVEYHHPLLGDFFLTDSPQEIALLDSGAGGWERTGEFFLVHKQGVNGAVPMCRFYSGNSYAPFAAHFFTPFAGECASLRAGAVWAYEGDAIPVRFSTGGICDFGALPLYRLYDAGRGGVPLHRLTVSERLRRELRQDGWIEESTRLFVADICARGQP